MHPAVPSIIPHTNTAMVSFYFSRFCSYSGYIPTPEDLELGASDEKEHIAFVFLGLDYLTQYDLFCSTHLLAEFMTAFLFTALYYSVVHIHHIFPSHLSGKGFLGYLHSLPLVTRIGTSTAGHVSAE